MRCVCVCVYLCVCVCVCVCVFERVQNMPVVPTRISTTRPRPASMLNKHTRL